MTGHHGCASSGTWPGARATSLSPEGIRVCPATRRRGLLLAPVLAAAYAFLYAALQSEDYALLIGSLGLFVILAGVMILTRKVDWYRPGARGR